MTSYSYHLAFDYKLNSLAMKTHQFNYSIEKETCTHLNKLKLKKEIFTTQQCFTKNQFAFS